MKHFTFFLENGVRALSRRIAAFVAVFFITAMTANAGNFELMVFGDDGMRASYGTTNASIVIVNTSHKYSTALKLATVVNPANALDIETRIDTDYTFPYVVFASAAARDKFIADGLQ